MQHVKDVLTDTAADVPGHGALALVDADLPILGRLSFSGYSLLYPRQLAKRASQPGPVAAERIPELALQLAVAFPSV